MCVGVHIWPDLAWHDVNFFDLTLTCSTSHRLDIDFWQATVVISGSESWLDNQHFELSQRSWSSGTKLGWDDQVPLTCLFWHLGSHLVAFRSRKPSVFGSEHYFKGEYFLLILCWIIPTSNVPSPSSGIATRFPIPERDRRSIGD